MVYILYFFETMIDFIDRLIEFMCQTIALFDILVFKMVMSTVRFPSN